MNNKKHHRKSKKPHRTHAVKSSGRLVSRVLYAIQKHSAAVIYLGHMSPYASSHLRGCIGQIPLARRA